MTTEHYYWDELTDNVSFVEDDKGDKTLYQHESGEYGKLVSEIRDDEVSYYHYDGNFNTLALTDANGSVTNTYTYSAYGDLLEQTGTTENEFRFGGGAGYYSQDDIGDIYIRNRTYRPNLGRWFSTDSKGFIDGPNLYQYVLSQPTNYVDYSGEQGKPTVMDFYNECKKFEKSIMAGLELKCLNNGWKVKLNCVLSKTVPPNPLGPEKGKASCSGKDITIKVLYDLATSVLDVQQIVIHELTHANDFCTCGEGCDLIQPTPPETVSDTCTDIFCTEIRALVAQQYCKNATNKPSCYKSIFVKYLARYQKYDCVAADLQKAINKCYFQEGTPTPPWPL